MYPVHIPVTHPISHVLSYTAIKKISIFHLRYGHVVIKWRQA